MACYSSINGITINEINNTNLRNYFLHGKKVSEEIIKNVEDTTVRNCRKKIHSLNLKKMFEIFVKDKKDLSEKDKYLLFIKNHVAELLLQINVFEEFFKSEELDKTNKKHVEKLKKIIFVMDRIDEIDLIFDLFLDKRYRGNYQLKKPEI